MDGWSGRPGEGRAIDVTEPLHTRCYASLRVYTGDHHPDVVTARLGPPTSTSLRGRMVGPNRVMRWRVEPLNAWFRESDGAVREERALEAHLDWLIERTSASAVRSLVEDLAMDVRLRCVWWHAAGRGGGPTLAPSYLRWMADAAIPFELDLGGELRE